MRARCIMFLLLCVLLCCLQLQVTHSSIAPNRLRVEYMDNPIGIDVLSPRFFWAVDTNGVRGADQSNYEVIIYDRHSGAVIANSTRIASSNTVSITVNNFQIESNMDYRWTVQLWDTNSSPSDIATSFFSAGLLSTDDWQNAQWIGLPTGNEGNQLRAVFQIPSAFEQVRCYIASPGYYTASINDRRVSDHVLGYFTTFEMRVYYDTFECGHLMKVGSNAFGITLGNGWYSQPTVNVGPRMVQILLRIVLASVAAAPAPAPATVLNIVSNAQTFTQYPGPIVYDDIYAGEYYNALLETPGWLTPEFDDSLWKKATEIANPTVGQFSSSAVMPVIRKTDAYTPLSISEAAVGIYVVDFGQNVAGFCRITFPGNSMRGHNVTVMHSEQVDVDGFVQNIYGKKTPMMMNYTLRGDGEPEVYEPSFTYFGYQYVQTVGFPGVLSQSDIVSYLVHTDFATPGSIVFGPSTVNELNPNASLLNHIQHMTRYASLSNYMNVPTDCPQRERRAWLGDAQLAAETNLYNFEMAASYTKYLRDIRDSQLFLNASGALAGGGLADTAPFYAHGKIPGDPSWTCAYIFLVYWMHRFFGDTRLIAEHYSGMKSQLAFVESQMDADGLLPLNKSWHGDWCAVEPDYGGPKCQHMSALLNTFQWAKQCLYFAELANISSSASFAGNANDSQLYYQKYVNAKHAIYKHYWNASLGMFYDPVNHIPIATLNSIALNLGVLSSAANNSEIAIASCVENGLVNEIVHKQSSHSAQGIVGVKYIFAELCKHGHCELAMTMNTQLTYPSYGYWYLNGATTLWEDWPATRYKADGSKNHIMFGSQSAWYYQYLAGIQPALPSTNWQLIDINPFTNATRFGISIISASIDTYRGQISFEWQVFASKDKWLQYNVDIPCGATARVYINRLAAMASYVPQRLWTVYEGTQIVWQNMQFSNNVNGVLSGIATTNDQLMFEIESGEYVFYLQTE